MIMFISDFVTVSSTVLCEPRSHLQHTVMPLDIWLPATSCACAAWLNTRRPFYVLVDRQLVSTGYSV